MSQSWDKKQTATIKPLSFGVLSEQKKEKIQCWYHGNRGTPPWIVETPGYRQSQRRRNNVAKKHRKRNQRAHRVGR